MDDLISVLSTIAITNVNEQRSRTDTQAPSSSPLHTDYERQTDGHLAVFARSQWFRTLFLGAVPYISVDAISGTLSWRGSCVTPASLERCLAACVLVISRSELASHGADDGPRPTTCNDDPQGGSRRTSSKHAINEGTDDTISWDCRSSSSSTQPPGASPPLSALKGALLTSWVPVLLACDAPLNAVAQLLRPQAQWTSSSAAAPVAAGDAAPGTAAAVGASAFGGSAAGLPHARPAAALLCRAAVELVLAEAAERGGLAAAEDAFAGAIGKAEAEAGPPGREAACMAALEAMVRRCCDILLEAQSEAEEPTTQPGTGALCASGPESGGISGLTVGQAAAVYVLAAVCVCCKGGPRPVVETGDRLGHDPPPLLPAGLLHQLLDVWCKLPKRPGDPVRPHMQAVLLGPLLRCCRAALPRQEYGAAAARALLAWRSGSASHPPASSYGKELRGQQHHPRHQQPCGPQPLQAVRGPPDLTVTPAVREAIAALSPLQEHVVAAVQHDSGVARWVLHELLPPALLAPGDRPTRVRSLAVLRACVAAGCGPAVPGWSNSEWEALGDLLHVQEEHMFHLVQPVWAAFMPDLLRKTAHRQQQGQQQHCGRDSSGERGDVWQLATWLAVPMLKACQHVNVSVRRLGLYDILQQAVQPGDQGNPLALVASVATPAASGSAAAVPVGESCCSLRYVPAGWWATLLDFGDCQGGLPEPPAVVDVDFGGQRPEPEPQQGPAIAAAEAPLVQQPQILASGFVAPPPTAAAAGPGPALWLLEQLLPVLEHDRLVWEHMPGCNSLQRHGTAVRQLRSALAAFLAATVRHLMSPPAPSRPVLATLGGAATGFGSRGEAAGAASAAALICCCLAFALQGTSRATAAAFLLSALQRALAGLADGPGGSEAIAALAAAVVGQSTVRDGAHAGTGDRPVLAGPAAATAAAAGAFLRIHLLPLLTRQALQQPRDAQERIRAAVLDLVPCLLDPRSVCVQDALDLVSTAQPPATSAAATAAEKAIASPRDEAGNPGGALLAADTGDTALVGITTGTASARLGNWTPAFLAWLSGVLGPLRDPKGTLDGEPAVVGWLAAQLQPGLAGAAEVRTALPAASAAEAATASDVVGVMPRRFDSARLEALASVLAFLEPALQLRVLRAVAAAANDLAADIGGGGGEMMPVAGPGEEAAGTAAAGVLTLVVALGHSYDGCFSGADSADENGAVRSALREATLAAAPILLAAFWRSHVELRKWDERFAYGVLDLVEILASGSAGPVNRGGCTGDAAKTVRVCGEAGRAVLATSCRLWSGQLLGLLCASTAAGNRDGAISGGSATSGAPLDQQLALLAAACVAVRAVGTAKGSTGAASDLLDGRSEGTSGRMQGGAASDPTAPFPTQGAVVGMLHAVLQLEPAAELSSAYRAALAESGAVATSGAARLELLPVFMELKWRLVLQLLTDLKVRRAGAAGPGEADDGRPGVSGGTGGGRDMALPWELREALCESALQDLDCAPDRALPYILDVLLISAPYNDVLCAVQSAALHVRPQPLPSLPLHADGQQGAIAAATIPPEDIASDAASSQGQGGRPQAASTGGADASIGGVEISYNRAEGAAAFASAASPLRLLQRVQAGVLAAVRGARRVPPELAVRAPQLACHAALLLLLEISPGAAPADNAPRPTGKRRPTAQPSGTRQQRQQEQQAELDDVWREAEALLDAAGRLAASTSTQAVPQLLQFGGSRVALAAAAHLCGRALRPNPSLQRALLPPLVHLLAFSSWSPRVDAKGLLSRKFEPHQALPARAAVCAWLEQLDGRSRDGTFLRLLMTALLRIACACRPGAMPPGMDGSHGQEPGGHQLQTQSQSRRGQQQQQQQHGPLQGAGDPQAAGASAAADDAAAKFGDYSFLRGREASQSSTMNAMKVALWQTVCLVARRLHPEAAGAAARAVWCCLDQPHHHSNLRPLMQQALLALLDRWPEGVERLLLPALRQYDTASYQVCVSRAIVGCLLLQRQASSTPPGPQVQQLLEALTPWALHHRHAVRVPVQTVLHAFLERHYQQPHSPPPSPEAPALPPLLHGVWRFLGTHPEQAALRSRQALLDLAGYDLDHECSLQGLFGIREEVLTAAAAAGEAVEVDPGQPSAWAIHTRDRLPIDVLRALPAIVRSLGARRHATGAAGPGASTAPSGADLEEAAACEEAGSGDEGGEGDGDGDGDGQMSGADDDEGGEEDVGAEVEDPEAGGCGSVVGGGPGRQRDPRLLRPPPSAAVPSYQLRPQLLAAGLKHAGAPAADGMAGLAAAVGDRLDAVAAAAHADASRPMGLVVVASLLENIPNMAGLCRTCESMGCEALVLPSRQVASSEAFKRQAVTSERWLPLVEVGPRDLATYLREMSGRGYTLVGVEQAAGSVPLQGYPFPRRCVLLLGNEQSGVPQALIEMMDACVEIPMLGVTRSLNAHVSGAMAVWQYVQQQQQQQHQQSQLQQMQ